MAALPQLMSVEQFRQLPEDEFEYELHFGEVVAMTRPKPRHWRLQKRIADLLEARLEAYGHVGVEIPFRLLPEFDLRAADVAVISHARMEAMDLDDDLRGAPELVIEVKSPSNTDRQLLQRAIFCLSRGAMEFWIVDTVRKSVTVLHPDGVPAVFAAGDSISLAAFGGGELAVDEIFA
jgi:Uma2 family endonuclease